MSDGIDCPKANMNADNATEMDYYDLQGHKLDKPTKGINIIVGRKVLKK
ncbi:MAG: hypothetical protein IJ219_08165 [Bacteroidaceae bacterium]|nr:hypothetical protein [Bacteroidaceae bacterium]